MEVEARAGQSLRGGYQNVEASGKAEASLLLPRGENSASRH